jgi:hypothetical protein
VVILPVRSCPCDLPRSWRAPTKPRDFPVEVVTADAHARRIVCRHTKVGRIASINLGTSTLATQRMHCDYQLWMHLLTLSHHPRALIGQPPLTQRLFSVQWTPSDHFLPPFSPLLNFHFQLQGLLQRPGVRLDLKVPS